MLTLPAWCITEKFEHLDSIWFFQENIRLLKVDLSWNGFGVDGAKALGATLAENGVLERLNLAGNRMSDVAIMHIATGLGRNEGLLELNVRVHLHSAK